MGAHNEPTRRRPTRAAEQPPGRYDPRPASQVHADPDDRAPCDAGSMPGRSRSRWRRARSGDSAERMVRGPSIHVFNADRTERIPALRRVRHRCCTITTSSTTANHNILWGYDPDTNGPMIPWARRALRDRLPTLLRRAGRDEARHRGRGAGLGHLGAARGRAGRRRRARPARRRTRPRQGRHGLDVRWKAVHPQFNTVEEGEY